MNVSDVYLLICKNFIGNFNILLQDLFIIHWLPVAENVEIGPKWHSKRYFL